MSKHPPLIFLSVNQINFAVGKIFTCFVFAHCGMAMGRPALSLALGKRDPGFMNRVMFTLFRRGSPTAQAKSTRKEKRRVSATKRAVLGTKVVVLGMCNNSDGLDSRSRIFAATHMVRFYHGGRAELACACQQSPGSGFRKSLRELEVENIED